MTTIPAPRPNTFLAQGFCPLCHEAAAADVSTYLALEEEGFGGPVFSLIKELHPAWLEEHGTCGSCWSFYANLVRVLNATGSFDARFRISPHAPRNAKPKRRLTAGFRH
jgi:hypothetical protein